MISDCSTRSAVCKMCSNLQYSTTIQELQLAKDLMLCLDPKACRPPFGFQSDNWLHARSRYRYGIAIIVSESVHCWRHGACAYGVDHSAFSSFSPSDMPVNSPLRAKKQLYLFQ